VYVVKASGTARVIFVERVLALSASQLLAPVRSPALVEAVEGFFRLFRFPMDQRQRLSTRSGS
jgi:hypothetical protein